MDNLKIFCIGLSKTATTSLSKALISMDVNDNHFPLRLLEWNGSKPLSLTLNFLNWITKKLKFELLNIRPMLYQLGTNNFLIEKLKEYESASDLPIGYYYKELDLMYPGSKFILTVRDEDAWIESTRHHFHPKNANQRKHNLNKMRMDVYGSIIFNEKKFREAYRNHISEVTAYFKNKPDSLLIINLCSFPDWREICAFLDRDIPNKVFPHANKSSR